MTKCDVDKRRRSERPIAAETKITSPHNKRRRRIHEIENLVYEGAGGKTPIPDLSLRDSDVFSNIKLRRREAAKRGIVPRKAQEDDSKTVLYRNRIKTAAHKRAIANKNRKRSIESTLRKYGKKDRLLSTRKDEIVHQLGSHSIKGSCVKISVGTSNPQSSKDGHYELSTQDQATNASTPGDNKQNNICAVSRERKCTPTPSNDAVLNSKTVDSIDDNSRNDDGRNYVSFTSDSKASRRAAENTDGVTASKISQRHLSTELNDTDNSHYRRTSKRILNRKQSNDHRSNEKKIDDDEISISSTNFETDSTRSGSPLRLCYRNANNPKLRRNYQQTAKQHRSKSRSHKQANSKQCKFSLMSCFPAESAMTLAAAFGDLKPSYSMKTTGKAGLLSRSTEKWNIGASALSIKQQLQRDIWRNMTLDMFTNR